MDSRLIVTLVQRAQRLSDIPSHPTDVVALEARDLYRFYHSTTDEVFALRGVSMTVVPGEMVSTLFIRPGYPFKVIDGMFTNFHMPRTSMLLMIAALAGSEQISKAYEAAVENRYRFLSFGDSMLIL